MKMSSDSWMSMLKIVVAVTVNSKRGKIGFHPHGVTPYLEPTPPLICLPAQPQLRSSPPIGAGSAGRAPGHGVQVGGWHVDVKHEGHTADAPEAWRAGWKPHSRPHRGDGVT